MNRNKEIALIAAAYYRVASDTFNEYLKWIDSEDAEVKNEVRKRTILPALVNMAFSVELCLKSLLPEKTRGHEIKELFDKLDESDKRELTMGTCGESLCENEKFEKGLEETSNAFAEWRYLHEGKSIHNAKYSLMKALTENILDMYGIEHD